MRYNTIQRDNVHAAFKNIFKYSGDGIWFARITRAAYHHSDRLKRCLAIRSAVLAHGLKPRE